MVVVAVEHAIRPQTRPLKFSLKTAVCGAPRGRDDRAALRTFGQVLVADA